MTANTFTLLGDNHALMLGKTGVGKTSLLQAMARSIALAGEGFTFPDLHGEAARDLAAWLASPASGCAGRVLHYLNFSTSVFALNLFHCDGSPEACHAAANMWASVLESVMDQKSEQLPRLARINYVIGYALAENHLTLLDMPAFLSLGGNRLRERVLANFDNPIIAPELYDLHTLAARYPREFLAQVESAKNRTIRWLGNPRIAAVLGQRRGLDARAVMDAGDIVLLDLSALSPADAAFMAKVLTCIYALAARQRKPHASRMHRLLLDEADAILCNATTELLDALRKFGLTGIFSLQRTKQASSQSRPNGDTLFDALMVNTGIKIVFNIPDPDTAEYLARTLFSSIINLQEFKPESLRPLAVGNDRIIVKNRTRGASRALSESSAETDIQSWARASAAISASMQSSGSAFGAGESMSFASLPPEALLDSGRLVGRNAGRNISTSSSSARALSNATSSSQQYARGRVRTHARATAEGTSCSEGESESYITRYENRFTEFYSLPEQIHRYTAVIMSLARREVILKVEGQAPIRTKTANLKPAFHNEEAKQVLVPLFLDHAARRSPYVMTMDQARANIAAHLNSTTNPPPEPDFAAPEPVPIIDALERARDLFKQRSSDTPVGDPPGRSTPNLRIVPGGKADGDSGT